MRVSGDDPVAQRAFPPPQVGRLKRRADFLHVGKGRRWHGKTMTVQAAARAVTIESTGRVPQDGERSAVRVGFTLTKKVGCAVVRNRARRRLRDAVRMSSELPVRLGYDYVVVGRMDAVRLPFDALKQELVRALRAIHEAGERQPNGGKTRRDGRTAKPDSVKGTGPTEPKPERTRPKS